MDIREDDLSSEQTQALLALHLAGMYDTSPPEHVHALDVDGLTAPDVTMWTAWEGGAILGCGALRELDPAAGEIKSMRTHPDHLRRGVGGAILVHILGVARGRGYLRVSLETGGGPDFDAAVALYLKHGFTFGEAFADYQPGEFSQFLHLDL